MMNNVFKEGDAYELDLKQIKNGNRQKPNLLQVANTYYTSAGSSIDYTISMTVELIVNRLRVHTFPIPLFDWSIKTECYSMDRSAQTATFGCKFHAGQSVL